MHVKTKASQGSFLNLGGHEELNEYRSGDYSPIIIGDTPTPSSETWLRFAGKQAGRVLQSTTDIVISPAKWLEHMQSYW